MAKHLCVCVCVCVCVCYAPNQTIKIIIHQLFVEKILTHTLFKWSLLSLLSSQTHTLSLSLFNGICIHEMQLLNWAAANNVAIPTKNLDKKYLTLN